MNKQGCVWMFDPGNGSFGEAVRTGNTFLPKASLSSFLFFHRIWKKTGEDCPRRIYLRNALAAFAATDVSAWRKGNRLALLTLS
jgi:hypothetical protein